MVRGWVFSFMLNVIDADEWADEWMVRQMLKQRFTD